MFFKTLVLHSPVIVNLANLFTTLKLSEYETSIS